MSPWVGVDVGHPAAPGAFTHWRRLETGFGMLTNPRLQVAGVTEPGVRRTSSVPSTPAGETQGVQLLAFLPLASERTVRIRWFSMASIQWRLGTRCSRRPNLAAAPGPNRGTALALVHPVARAVPPRSAGREWRSLDPGRTVSRSSGERGCCWRPSRWFGARPSACHSLEPVTSSPPPGPRSTRSDSPWRYG